MNKVQELYLSIACNLMIFLGTTLVVVSYFVVKDHEGKVRGISAFRFFTNLSNAFAGIVSLVVLIFELRNLYRSEAMLPHWLILLKFFATSTVALTFLTVMFYLGPVYGYKRELSGTSFYMHLLGPVLAIVSFCFFEDFDTISVQETFVGLIPILAYYYVYFRQVLLVSERDKDGNLIKGWEDFYGFNRGGKWYISGIVMMGVIIVILFALRAIYNM